MIHPVSTLSPGVSCRGVAGVSKKTETSNFERNMALINAGGLSVGIGAAMTAISRSYTSNWRHAGLIGAGAAAISMMFLAPSFLYKAGINTYEKTVNTDGFIKEKKIIGETNVIDSKKKSVAAKFENYTKNLLKKGV